MIRKVGFILVCMIGCLSKNAFSITAHTFQVGPISEYILPVKEPQTFSNVFMWPIRVYCTIISKEENNYLVFKVLRKSGSIDNLQLSAGDSRELTVHPDQKLYITAVSGAKVELENTGTILIKANCEVS